MQIAIIGAAGHIGSALTTEALRRGHTVTALVPHPDRYTAPEGVTAVGLDATDRDAVVRTTAGQDVVVGSISGRASTSSVVTRSAEALLTGLPEAGVTRLLWIGGAGSLEVAPGVRVIDLPEFPEGWKEEAQTQVDILDTFRAADTTLDWTYVSPAAMIEPGERTGAYRVGGDQLLVDAEGNSRISTEDFAIAVIDRAEAGDHARERITVAY